MADRREPRPKYTADRLIPGAFDGETVTRRRFMVGSANVAGVVAASAFVLPALAFALGPVFEKASEKHPDAVFGKVDTEAQPEVAATFNITSIPTLMIIRDNIVLYAQPGALPEKALEELITKAEAIDMDEVRASVAQAQAESATQAEAPAH